MLTSARYDTYSFVKYRKKKRITGLGLFELKCTHTRYKVAIHESIFFL